MGGRRRRSFFRPLLLPLLLLRGLPRCSAGTLRSRTCLANATHALSQRRNVTIGGVSQALRLGVLDWDSAKIMSWMFRIILEEVMGINVVFSATYPGSDAVFNELVACTDPATKAVNPHFTGPHIVMGVWMLPSLKAHAEDIRRHTPELAPLELGDMGYSAYEGVFLKEGSFGPAMRQEYLPLDVYISYSHPAFDPMRYFDSPWNISTDQLKPCNATRAADVSAYFRIYNDTEGVTITQGADGVQKVAANCPGGYWWLSPTCRSDPSRCVPFITAGTGWDYIPTMQRVTAWNMPVAIGVSKRMDDFRELPRRLRVLFNWWIPDSTFASMGTKQILWPPFDSLEHSQGNFRTERLTFPITKWGCADLESRSNTGLAKPLAVLRNMKLILADVSKLVRISEERQGNKDEVVEAVACEWLNSNVGRYSEWIPLNTACIEQQGLVSKAGAFVDSREEAQACEWCSPGRISVAFKDQDGRTHRCNNCSAGTFTKSLGRTACEECVEGQFARQGGMHACELCPSGRYAARQGQVLCDGCPPGFMTSEVGSTSAAACICPRGFYRPKIKRGACEPCKEGMDCPAGSDALGYLPVFAEKYPVVPLLRPGFWASSEEPLNIFRCENDVRCPGGRRPGDACAAKLEQVGCAACADGHFLAGSTCAPCYDTNVNILLFPVLPILILMVVILGGYRYDGEPYSTWGNWAKGSGSTVLIVLNHYHVTNILHAANVVPQKDVSGIFGRFMFLSDVLSIFMPECTGFSSFWSQLILQSHGPSFLSVLYVVVWCCSLVLGAWKPWLRMDANRLFNGLFAVIFAFFTRVVDMALAIFKCSSNPNGLLTLTMDRSIICFESDWNGMITVGALAVLIWCVGFGMVISHAIYVAPSRFHEIPFQTRNAFLFERYRPDVHWWGLVILAKGVLLNMGSVFCPNGVAQIYWIQAVVLVYAYLLVSFRPWRHGINNPVDIFVNLSLFLTCSITVWFSHDAMLDMASQDDLGRVLLTLNLALATAPILPACAIMVYNDLSKRAAARKHREVNLIMHALEHIACLELSETQLFLKTLTEHDFELMRTTKGMLLTELGRTKVRPGYCVHQLSRLSIARVNSEMNRAATDGMISLCDGHTTGNDIHFTRTISPGRAKECRSLGNLGDDLAAWNWPQQASNEMLSTEGVTKANI